VVYPEAMQANLDRLGGLHNSQRVLLALTQAGMSREDAYEAVQRCAMAAWEKGEDFAGLLKGDKGIKGYLSETEIDAMFDMAYHVKHVDAIFERVFPS
jgi:adenylosuccinate lyase